LENNASVGEEVRPVCHCESSRDVLLDQEHAKAVFGGEEA
jgi:hypothetical protein